jgi:hypothetical protein
MRSLFLVLFGSTALAAGLLLAPSPSQADPYKWCAVYGGRDGGASNCGFVTLEQCQATVSGIGGFCQENQFYTGPAEKPAKRKRKRHDD